MNILGIHLDAPFIRTCLLRKGRGGIQIISLNEDTNVNPLYMKSFKGRIASGLPAKDFLIRSMEMKVSGSRHIEDAIAFQSEALSHFKPEEVITVPHLGKKENGKAEALLFTVPRDGLREHLKILGEHGINPDAVTTIPSALSHFVRWKFPSLREALIVDLGSNETTCVLMDKGELKKSHSIGKGIERLLGALHEDRKKILLKKEIEGAAKQIDLLLLKPGLNPHLSGELNELRKEIGKVFYSFTRGTALPIIFTGRCTAFIHLKEYLIDFPEGEWVLTHEEEKFGVSIGLALEHASPRSLQLRQDEFFPVKNWSRMGLYALSILAASISLSIALLAFGFVSSSSKKGEMLNSLQTASRKNLMTQGTVEDQIDQWISAVEKNNKEYPYILQAPKATDVLTWLSNHPLLEELKKEGDPIQLREVKYQLVSYPTLGSETEPFLAKVEIEFDFQSPMNGRKFHEALRAGDEWVDGDSEVTWDGLGKGFRATFFMKNQRPHVP